MDSITKTRVTDNQIRELFRNSFGSSSDINSMEELKDGYFNTAYSIRRKDGFRTILKIAPPKAVRLMRYEKDLMRAEVETLNMIKSLTDVPVPEVYAYNAQSDVIENEYFFMEYLEGIPFNKLMGNLSPESSEAIFRQLGSFTKEINEISGESFGYISQENRTCKSWAEAFTMLITDVLEDGMEADVKLPISYDELQGLIDSRKNILASVTGPRLIHKDLWAGNIFVNPETLKITGIVDCERALWGDPLMEFVCGLLEDNAGFNIGYGREKASTPRELCLKSMYSLYLDLILVIECKYRLYPTDDQEKWARKMLENEIDFLKNLRG